MSKSDINNTSIAVIGIGCMFPDSKNSNQYWSLIKNKEDAIRAIPGSHWKQEDYFDPDPKKPDMTYGKTGGFLKPVDFDPMEYGVTPNAIEAIDTSQLLGLVVAKQTLEDSGYDKKEFNRDKVGVILGITGAQELVIPLGARLGHPLWKKAIKAEGGDDEFAQNVADRIANGYVQWQEQSFPGLLGNVVSGRIANFFDLGGTNLVVDAACGSSLGAVNMAYMELATKRADMMITGGVDTFNDIFMYMCFSKTPALSSEGNSKPFSADGDGTVLGEGIGMVLLKREEDAIRDGDKIYALIKGVGSGSDGKGAAIFAPQSKGQVKAIRQAYETSGIAPETITLMEAHGTGTKVGDGIELTSMETVYSGADGRSCALGSVKSQIGHCKAAAGAAGLIKSILSLHNKTLPPSTKVNTPLPQLENESFPFYLNTECRPWIADPSHPRRAAVSAFGFGGSNFHCVLEESGKKKEKTDWDYNTQILALEGSSKEELKSQVQKISAIGWEDFCTLANESRQNYRGKANYRLICTVHKTTFDAGKLQESSMLAIEKETSRPYAEGVFFGKGSFDGKISFIFPGQGAQYTGMLRELACTFPDMLGSLELMASSFEKGKSPDIKKTLDDFIYPKYSFGENTLPLLEKELTNTQVAQPALGALSLGAANVLKEFGLSPDYTAGHSYGELAALCAGERLNPEDFCELSVLRGRLMGEGGKDRGTMCAVMADFETLDSLLRKNGIDVVIANRNAPKQMVISGARSEIARAMEILAANSITAKEIPVAAAFHSPLIADAQVPFARKMKRIKLNESQMEVFSNTTALPYPQNCAEASELLAIQLAKPVLFTDEIHAMYEKGARMFIEVGPGARMSGLIKQILSDKNDIFVYSLDSSQGKRSGMTDLALLLSSIAAAGTDVNLSAWAPEIKPEVKAAKRFTVSICGANYVSPRKEIPPANKVYKAVKPGAEQSETDRQPEVKQQPAGGVFAAIQSMQQQTSSLHQQFLENQQQILIALQKMAGVTDLSAVRPALTTQAPVIQHIPQAQTISISPAAAVQQPAAAKKSVSVSGTAAPQNFIKDITAVIAEKTGYPQEMLETSMDMEADLGIDSIKKVEIFSALRDKLPQMPPMASEDMATIRTIDAIIAFLAGAQPPQRTPQQQHANASLIADITAVIAEKTGYPQEMLDTSMDMEADLGIDSIKKVEIFSALRDKLPQMPPMASEDMATIRTIDAIIAFLAGAQPPQQTPQQQHANASLLADITAVIAEKTGYPQEMLETSMDMEADLGIDSIKKVEIFSALRDKLPQMPPMASEDMATIRTIDAIIAFLAGAQPAQQTPQQHANASLIADITAVISEKTGYPQEMLETSMDMEADLGIDSIKKVEIFSALRDKLPQMPPMASEDMATIRTIDAIITFLAGAQPAQQTPQQHANASLIADITAVIAEKTGYPQEMLETSMDMEADLGIDSIKKVEIFSALRDKLPQMPPMASEDMATIRTIDDVESFIKGLVSNNKAAEKAIEVGNAAQGENNCGYREHLQRFVLRLSDTGKERKSLKNNKNTVCILGENSGLNKKIAEVLKQNGAQTIELKLSEFDGSKVKNINGLVIISGQEKAAGNYLLQAFKAVRAIVPPMAKSAAEPFFVTISMLDGTFGLENPGSIKESIYGGLAGLAKTSALEFPAVKCKAIDFAPELSGDETSIKQLAAEILTEGPDEVSISAKGIRRLETVKENQPGILNWPVDKDGVIIVTGGARGVTSECIIHMAEHAPKNNKPHFVLLGRTQLKDEAEWLTALTEETAIKRELMKRMDKPTPAEIGAGFKEIAAGREIRNVLARIRQKGVSADYVTADVRDKKRLTEIFTEIRANNGNISGFIHGAGVLADKKIEDKSDEEFSSVCSTKIDGMKNILDILSEDDLKMIAFFSSSTARFGRKGQIDYSAANEVLNKTAQQQKALRPECKVVSFNWGPWDGGMVNEGLKKLFASEGIGVIPMEDGAHFMFNEMCLSKTADVEVAVIAETPKQYSTIYEREISSENHSVLTDHVIGGKAVLPTALMIELMAHGAMLAKPGEVFCGFDNMRVNSGLKLEPGEQRKYRVSTAQGHEAGGLTYIPVRLESSRDGKVYLLNSSADIILSYEKIKLGKPGLNPQMSQYGHSMEEVYHEKLFHGQALRGIISVDGYSAAAIRGTAKKSPKPSSWIKNPLRSNWIAEPMMLDSSFQLMILWTIENMKKPSLPCFISSYRQEGTVKPETLTVTAKIISQRENTVIADIEFTDKKGNLIAVIKGYECTANESLILPFKANKLPEHSGMALV